MTIKEKFQEIEKKEIAALIAQLPNVVHLFDSPLREELEWRLARLDENKNAGSWPLAQKRIFTNPNCLGNQAQSELEQVADQIVGEYLASI